MNIIAHTYNGTIEDNVVITGRGPALYMAYLATDLTPTGSQNLVFRNNYWGSGFYVPRVFLLPAQGSLSIEATADARFYADTIATMYDVPDIGLADCCYHTQTPFFDLNVFPDGGAPDVEIANDLANPGDFFRLLDTTRIRANADTAGQVEFAGDPSEDFAIAVVGGEAEFGLLSRRLTPGADDALTAVARLVFPPGITRVDVEDVTTGAAVPVTVDGQSFLFPLEGRHCYEVTFELNRPPDCWQAAPTVSSLWPPDHGLVGVGVTGVTDPDGDPVAISITGVTQDEPIAGTGRGDKSPDASPGTGGRVNLRAERAGTGDGRVYHVHFVATDGKGGSCTGRVTVCVPHDRRGAPCVDGGEIHSSYGGDATPCGPSTCPAGTFCCNVSCGICALPDHTCTQQFCGGGPGPT
jgi:hypothetical protein